MAVTSPMLKTIQFPVKNLMRLHRGLAQALSNAGINGAQLSEVLSARLRVECTQCTIGISGDELMLLTAVAEGDPLPHPKLLRLRFGDCARAGCDSLTYLLHLEDHPGVDWDLITKNAETLASEAVAAAKVEEQRRANQKRNRKILRLAGWVATGIVLVGLAHYRRNGHLPFVKKHHKYQVDPASVSSNPAH